MACCGSIQTGMKRGVGGLEHFSNVITDDYRIVSFNMVMIAQSSLVFTI